MGRAGQTGSTSTSLAGTVATPARLRERFQSLRPGTRSARRKEWRDGPVSRLPVGVVGCGLIAQVMHLPHLRKLADRYEVVALCEVSPGTVEAVGEAFGVERRFTSIDDLLEAPIEAVLILTSGNHAPAATRAAASGRHVFVEKPICLRVSDGLELTTVARRSSVRIMAGYMKRHDPAFARFRDELDRTRDVRLVTFATMESPEAPYLAHHRVLRAPAPEPAVQAELRAMREADDRLGGAGIGSHGTAKSSRHWPPSAGFGSSSRRPTCGTRRHDSQSRRGDQGPHVPG